MHTVVIIHGSYGSPTENWFPWLAAQVRGRGHHVIVPSFPTPEGQSPTSWRKEFEAQVSRVNSNTILVGHSLGVAFILDVLERSKKPVAGTFLASGFLGELGNAQFDDVNRTFVCRDFNWEKICLSMGKAFVYHGDNDPYVPISKCSELSLKLNIVPNIIARGGHLNAEAGYMEFFQLWSDLSELLDS